MAHSVTSTSTRSTKTANKKADIDFAVPSSPTSKANKQPYEGLLMPDPGSDYDQHQNRLDIVDYMLNIAAETGHYRYMINWKNNAVFVDNEDGVEVAVKRTDSGIGMDEKKGGSDGSQQVKEEKVKKDKSIWYHGESGFPKMEKGQWGSDSDEWVPWSQRASATGL